MQDTQDYPVDNMLLWTTCYGNRFWKATHLRPARGLVVRLVVGSDSLVESDQKTLKVGNHSFPAW